MRKGLVKNSMIGLAALTISIIAAACSEQSTPLSPNSNQASDPFVGRGGSSGSTEIYGLVTSVDPSSSTMSINSSSLSIEVLATAEIVSRKSGVETPITLADINLGDSAEVRGNVVAGNVLSADRVRIRIEDNNANEVEISGRIQSVDAGARLITLQNNPTSILVAANAEVVQKVSGMETPIELSELAPGDSLDVRGTSQTDGSLLADRVRLRLSNDNDDFVSDLEFKSTITSIDTTAGTLTVSSRTETIVIDANTLIYRSDNISADDNRGNTPAGKMTPDDDGERGNRQRETIPFSALMVGDTVEVHADVVDANMLYAVAIEQEDSIMDHEIEFTDIIIFLDPSTREIMFGIEMLSGIVADNADLRDTANVIVPLEDFLVCGPVEVKGFMIDESTLSVTRMKMEDF